MSENKTPTEANPHGEWGKVLKEIKRRCKNLNIKFLQTGNGHIKIVTQLDEMIVPATPRNLKRHTSKVVKWMRLQREFLEERAEEQANSSHGWIETNRLNRHCEGSY
tara:strand:+ start:93 stop:413 length:321 start_codon:yes stop_codon:yes gene_type:complete